MEVEAPTRPAPASMYVPNIVSRLASLPYVESALNSAKTLYTSYGKENESMPLVKSTCEALEKQLQQLQTRAQPLLDRAMPIIDSNADTVKSLDDLACAQLDRVQHLASSLHQMQQDVYGNTTRRLTEAEEKMCNVTTGILNQADQLLEAYLPAKAEQEEQETTETDDKREPADANQEVVGRDARTRPLGAEASKLLGNARKFSSKVQTRMYAHALGQLQNVRTRTAEARANLQAVDLLEYAREHLDRVARDLDADEGVAAVDDSTSEQAASSDDATTQRSGAVSRASRAVSRLVVRRAARLARNSLDLYSKYVSNAAGTAVGLMSLTAAAIDQASQAILHSGSTADKLRDLSLQAMGLALTATFLLRDAAINAVSASMDATNQRLAAVTGAVFSTARTINSKAGDLMVTVRQQRAVALASEQLDRLYSTVKNDARVQDAVSKGKQFYEKALENPQFREVHDTGLKYYDLATHTLFRHHSDPGPEPHSYSEAVALGALPTEGLSHEAEEAVAELQEEVEERLHEEEERLHEEVEAEQAEAAKEDDKQQQ
ncbi:uncharacterized protein MONBRDRAFT_37085 [Monosiga brevicollis MX1]|uniref:Uncharacterized protein n=1 Tax=Monosiga brevicollis TaxID=81824 RepID=A9UZH3_MONBE|nr:uncharacterized protein MONBRDRAFT_37085 [Monosiga brevicollis MX1]EDQ89231.1 predicted protein [Monosiga brevicollis MX1]|eukprot:XP_001745807.1 hypothetical protein [Monosiga brevicollis MX1]